MIGRKIYELPRCMSILQAESQLLKVEFLHTGNVPFPKITLTYTPVLEEMLITVHRMRASEELSQ